MSIQEIRKAKSITQKKEKSEIEVLLDSVSPMVCTIHPYQMWEVSLHAPGFSPRVAYKSCDLLTAVRGAVEMYRKIGGCNA